jgi:hypothetical protein
VLGSTATTAAPCVTASAGFVSPTADSSLSSRFESVFSSSTSTSASISAEA